MPLGEDIPMLVPISILITIFVLFLITLFINFSERNDVIKMSEAALDLTDLSANVIFADSMGTLNQTKLEKYGWVRHCMATSAINITVNYQTQINISKANSDDWWCWDNIDSSSKEPKTEITKVVPVIVRNGTSSYAAKLVVSIGK